ncbi:translocon-associated protein subunit alpha-like [Anneissia japonica]|uniref:translocon-associated protein subunit alpha-like n=1 Tax=Anneissia japonica TaxID=1529436 RepID=UPI00142589AD|nr:translocon-associated protein subunit alpha-like [Anneissia japonica]
MWKLTPKFLLLLLLVLPASVLLTQNEKKASLVATAQEDDKVEDIVEGEDEDAQVEEEEGEGDGEETDDDDTAAAEAEGETEEEEEERLKPSPDAEVSYLFTKWSEQELPVSKPIQLLIGFSNKGSKDFILDTVQASLRYPQEFSYHIHNFSTIAYNTVVEPGKEATLEYQFQVYEVFATRAFGFVVELFYKDEENNLFFDAVFNETITMIEIDEGLDTETFFMYVFLGALVILCLFGIQQLFASFGKKRKTSPKPVEMGTQNHDDVDMDWIPKEALIQKKTPSPRRSPRRRTKRSTGSGDE